MATCNTPISTKPQHLAPQLSVLSGWKDVASYLGQGVRTVQRYERELRLPVRRPAGRARGSVIAIPRELDQWISETPMTPQRAQMPQHILNLKNEVSELRRLCAEGRQLRAALSAQRTAIQLTIERIGKAISGTDIVNAERHRTVALEQEARAVEMRESACGMKNHAIEMRKAPRQQVIVHC
jgi:hypothetical protein